MRDSIRNDLKRRSLRARDRVRFGFPVKDDIYLGNFRDPTAIRFLLEFNREHHTPTISKTDSRPRISSLARHTPSPNILKRPMRPLDRRELLTGLATLLLSGTSPAAPGRNLKVQSPRPEDYEMELAGFESYLTPNDSFFVRTHTYTPTPDPATFELKIKGLVSKPLTLKLADLKRLKKIELVAVLECAGNGRANYRPMMPGLQWNEGSVGNAKWGGVRLKDVLAQAGVDPKATDIAINGIETPAGTQPKFVRSVPIAKCLHPDTLLAWEMNGQPLPVTNGGPLRLVVPGWAGDSWVKWVENMELIDHEFDGFFMKTAYRHPIKPIAPGAAVDPKDTEPVTWLNIKSVIHTPKNLAAGKQVVFGVAWSGKSPVAKVEVSIDDGKTWKLAKLDNRKTPYGWRMWRLPVIVPINGVLVAKATDEAGVSQPTEQQWNPSGYLWNVQSRLTIGPRPEPPKVTGVEFPQEVKQKCLVCHDDHMMQGQRLTKAQWDREVDKMTRWGAQVKPEEKAGIVDFLASKYKP